MSSRRWKTYSTVLFSASNDQSQGIEQVSQAVAQLNQVTQQNAANAEEAASAAEELDGQSTELQAMVDQFSLNKENHTPQTKSTGNGKMANGSLEPVAHEVFGLS